MKRLIFFFILMSTQSFAGEESLDLEETSQAIEKPVSYVPAAPKIMGPKIMGRMDLSFENLPFENLAKTFKNSGFKNNHFLIFLKVKATEKVSFFGEILSKTFFEINYSPKNQVNIHLGKIQIPFGETSRYHHFYGGVQGFGAVGVFFPNIWAEPGANLEWQFSSFDLDTYLVNGISAPTTNDDPSFTGTADSGTMAFGIRMTGHLFSKIKLIGSGYYDHWQVGKPLYMLGGDLIFDYGALIKNLKISTGFANGFVRQGVLGNYRRYGDFIEISTNALSFVEPRFRYGTFINNSLISSQKDTHSFDLGFNFKIDQLNLLAEYQWNFESVDEKKNDLLRVMLALDF